MQRNRKRFYETAGRAVAMICFFQGAPIGRRGAGGEGGLEKKG